MTIIEKTCQSVYKSPKSKLVPFMVSKIIVRKCILGKLLAKKTAPLILKIYQMHSSFLSTEKKRSLTFDSNGKDFTFIQNIYTCMN